MIKERTHRTLGPARRAECGFFVGFAFGNGQGEQLFTLTAEADFEIGSPSVVDFSREKQLQRVKSKDNPIGEFDQRESIVEYFKCRFLAFTLRKVSDD